MESKQLIAVYSIEKSVCEWDNFVAYAQQKEGANANCTLLLSEEGFLPYVSITDTLIAVCAKYGLDAKKFTLMKNTKNHYIAICLEDKNGNKLEQGEFLASYNIYIDLYQKVQLT